MFGKSPNTNLCQERYMSKVSKFNITLVFVACLLCALFCTTAFADEAETDVGYTETPVYIDGLLSFRGYTVGDTTYLPLECTCAVLGFESESGFNIETNTLTVKVEDIEITVCKDDEYICANGRYFYLPDGYMEIDGSAVVPIDAIERIFTLEAKWDSELEAYDLDTANKAILVSGDEFYNEEDLYWMSRIITYESGNQPIAGQIGVGNVVLNRVESSRFADTVKDVIFQQGQFAPVASGAIYLDPYEISTVCAKMVFEGYNTVGESLFFQQGRYGENWISQNTRFVINIADHNFFI